MISYKVVFWVSLIAIVPVSFWLTFFRTEKANAWGRNFLLASFWLGVLASLLAVFLEIFYFENRSNVLSNGASSRFFDLGFILSNLSLILPVALIEESSKSLVIFWAIAKKKILTLQNGLLLGVLAGLAFAVTENGIYFARFFNQGSNSLSGEFWQVVFLRFIFSTSAHVVYSGLCGFFLAEFIKRSTWKGKLGALLKAGAIPVAVHTTFNFLLETSFGWLIFLVVFVGLGVIYFLYSKKESRLFFNQENGIE